MRGLLKQRVQSSAKGKDVCSAVIARKTNMFSLLIELLLLLLLLLLAVLHLISLVFMYPYVDRGISFFFISFEMNSIFFFFFCSMVVCNVLTFDTSLSVIDYTLKLSRITI